ncbi:MAG: N-acetylmuramoyl-L-alanine amidase [Gammaproteobacteria bacterium]|nr:N-acetylmuramoyl-L-alanine amidase [Gammaproteobacteria bacterium]
MIEKVFRQGIGAVGAAVGVLSVAPATELRGIGLSASDDSAALNLELSERVAPHVFTLEHPHRVVIDLPHTRREHGIRAPAGSGSVTGLRLGVQPQGTLRVVLETRSSLPIRTAWSGHALRVSLGSTTLASAPVAAPAPVPAAPPASIAPVPTAMPAAAPPAPSPLRSAQEGGERDVIVAVDAGHGGQDPGAIGRSGTREKDVTLAIARALAARIDQEPGMRAVLTRSRDEFVPLPERTRRARQAHADMFISVHADSIADRTISGASVYVLSLHGASSEAARIIAERENSADLAGGVPLSEGDLTPILLDATQSEIIGVSATAAERVVSALQGVGELRKPQVQRAGFVVLKSPAIPSMLIETAYISNPAEERRLRSAPQQERLAEAIASGVRSFFAQNPPDGTRFKQQRRLASAAAAAPTATP